MNSKEPAQALHGKKSACPVRASGIIQPDKSHCRELAGPENGRIYFVSNVPGYRCRRNIGEGIHNVRHYRAQEA
ncbi:MAG: hypothetical protein ABSA06_05810 [Geobacteraceae bacterium]|jgi:hypothetical protein